jgi:hypothetical protein
MAMVNMKRAESERKDYAEVGMDSDGPDYPYGLCISLGKEELDKLGITSLPEVGTEMMVMAKGFVKSVSSHEYKGEGKHMSVEVQLTDVEVGAAPASTNAADALYGA